MRLSIKLLIMSLVFLCFTTHAFAKDPFDPSVYISNKDVFNIDIDTDYGVAFIELKQHPTFTHKYESKFYNNFIFNGILITDYFNSKREPIFLTKIMYSADNPLYITAVSFNIDDKTYTFSDVADKDRITKLDNGYMEQLIIVYGSNNFDFLETVGTNAAIYALGTAQEGMDIKELNELFETYVPKMSMVLHGLEDVEVEIPYDYLLDMGVFSMSFPATDIVSYIRQNNGTYCKVTQDTK